MRQSQECWHLEPHDALGHLWHEVAYVLYPQSRCLYSGTVMFSSSKPVGILVYHDVTDKIIEGITVHSFEGKYYAVTTLLENATKGTVDFVGAAVLAHTESSDPYGVVTSVDALRKSDTMEIGVPNSACH